MPLTDSPHIHALIEYPIVLPVYWDGGQQYDLVCGGCGTIIYEGFREMLHIHVDYQLVVVCPECGAKNVAPTTVYPMPGSPG